MIRWTAIAAIFVCLPGLVTAQEDNVTTFALENGMQVVVVEDDRAPVVQHMVWYRAGSADEPKGSSGVAHFLEHLLFKATENLEEGEFSATVARNGGRDNAFTSYDYTAYFQRVASDRLELMMEMEADRMKNIRLTEENIKTERDVIIEERNQRTENNPGALFGIYYSPNNAILVVTGNVTAAEVRELAEKHYGAIPANPDLPERLRTQEPPQTAERRLIYRDARVAQPYVRRSYLAPERDSGDQETAAALVFLSEILGGGTTSFLADELQFSAQIATYSASFYRPVSLDDTTFNIIVVPREGVSLQEAEDAMDTALQKFFETGIDSEQLARIKFQIKADQIYARDDVDRIGNRYGRALSSGLTVDDVQAWPDVLQAVTEDDIMQAARNVLDRRASVTGWIMREEVTQ